MFKINNNNYLKATWKLLVAVVLLTGSACNRPVVEIDHIPGNTPAGSRLYIAGNFNSWDPGDDRFAFTQGPDSNYYMKLPRGFGTVDFKITRGDWTTTETDICGYDIPNRSVPYRSGDTISISVMSWKDLEPLNCPEVTIVVDKLPKNTPPGAPIAIAGNFNEWAPDSASYMHLDSTTGDYVLTLPRTGKDRLIEFKITRGSLLKAEADRFGNEIDKRRVLFGTVDTLHVEVQNWEDLPANDKNTLTIILDKVPEKTYPSDNIYITGTFNGWYPKDNDYMLQKNQNGKYQIKLPKTKGERIEFKFTRGDWSKQEMDKWGYKIPNRQYTFGAQDTLHLTVANWEDRSSEQPVKYTLLVDSLPATTPPDAQLYLAASINAWDAGDRKYRFTKQPNGDYVLTLDQQTPYFEYKITRGNWDTQEANTLGQPITNRIFRFHGNDTTLIRVTNWYDLPPRKQDKVVIMLDSVPTYTPRDKHIFIAGTFNGWNPGDPSYILSKNLLGQYYITIPHHEDRIEFKFTLGSWDFEELNKQFIPIPNRVYHFGYTDTLHLKVQNWKGVSR